MIKSKVVGMTKKNGFFVRSRSSEKKFREITRLFVADITARQIALFSSVRRSCVSRVLEQVRIRIAEVCEQKSYFEI